MGTESKIKRLEEGISLIKGLLQSPDRDATNVLYLVNTDRKSVV